MKRVYVAITEMHGSGEPDYFVSAGNEHFGLHLGGGTFSDARSIALEFLTRAELKELHELQFEFEPKGRLDRRDPESAQHPEMENLEGLKAVAHDAARLLNDRGARDQQFEEDLQRAVEDARIEKEMMYFGI